MRLFIAEKPSLVRAIAEVLRGPQTRRYASCGRTTVRRISKIFVRTLDEPPVRLTEVNLNRRWVCPTCGLAADP
jgi:hypothetical protein